MTDTAPPSDAVVTDTVEANVDELPAFADLPIHPEIAAALAEQGIVHAFPIQASTLPVALAGNDIIGQAKTGTGKTLGFGVPLLNVALAAHDPQFNEQTHPGRPQALVVVPTRELCVQVGGDLESAGKRRGLRVECIYGGRAFEPQIAALRRGVEVIVGTPGRLLDLAQQGHLRLSNVKVVVLDEADEMLDLGFLPDVERILAQTPDSRQTMLFSATMPGAVVALARRYMVQPTHIRAASSNDEGATVQAIEQFAYRAHSLDKIEMIARILQAADRGLSIIFSRTKRTAAKVTDDLIERGFAAGAIHGDLGQGAREQALRAFRNGNIDVLVATDVAARGIDVDNVTHVINYQCPEDEKTYLHRTGRTGRAGRKGIAVTLVDWDDMHRWGLIDRALELGIPEPVETYSSSDHLYSDLGIDPDVTGRLPESKRTREGLDAEELEDLGETGRGASRARPGGRGRDGRGERGRRGRTGNSRGGRDGAGESGEGRSREQGGGRLSERADDAPRNDRPKRRRRRTRGGAPGGQGRTDGLAEK